MDASPIVKPYAGRNVMLRMLCFAYPATDAMMADCDQGCKSADKETGISIAPDWLKSSALNAAPAENGDAFRQSPCPQKKWRPD